eukprot:jgi/Bigna1/75048/fgenesh1_pg.32_\
MRKRKYARGIVAVQSKIGKQGQKLVPWFEKFDKFRDEAAKTFGLRADKAKLFKDNRTAPLNEEDWEEVNIENDTFIITGERVTDSKEYLSGKRLEIKDGSEVISIPLNLKYSISVDMTRTAYGWDSWFKDEAKYFEDPIEVKLEKLRDHRSWIENFFKPLEKHKAILTLETRCGKQLYASLKFTYNRNIPGRRNNIPALEIYEPQPGLFKEVERRIREERDKRFSKAFENRKLRVLLDLDHTLISTGTYDPKTYDPKIVEKLKHQKYMECYETDPKNPTRLTFLRPELIQYMKKLKDIAELTVVSAGKYTYVERICKKIEKECGIKKLFEKIISVWSTIGKESDVGTKDIRRVLTYFSFPGMKDSDVNDYMTAGLIILDDLDVWTGSDLVKNFYKIDPFHVRINPSKSVDVQLKQIRMDDKLQVIYGRISKYHEKFFEGMGKQPVLKYLKKGPLTWYNFKC